MPPTTMTTAHASPWVTAQGAIEATIPVDFARDHNFEAGQPVSFSPVLSDGAIAWHVVTDETVDPDAENVTRIKHNVEPNEQYFLRWPRTPATMAGLTTLVADKAAQVRYQDAAQGIRVETWPPAEPVSISGQPSAEGVAPLIETETHARFEMPVEVARALQLSKEMLARYKFAVRAGSLGMVVEFEEGEATAPNERQVQMHPVHEKPVLYVPVSAADALSWMGSRVRAGAVDGRLVLSSAAGE